MFSFKSDQTIADICNIKIGGHPGQYPIVMIGSLFYTGHKLVFDHQKGEFNKKAVLDLLKIEAEMAEKTGLPRMIDVIGESTEALEKYINFIAENTEVPILLDSPSEEVRINTLCRLDKTLLPRLVYNSIDIHVSDKEINAIGEAGVKHLVFMAFTSKHIRPGDRLKILKETDIITKLKALGVANILIDTGVLDVPSISWSAKAIQLIKEDFGLPSGCAPSNAMYMWKKKCDLSDTFFKAAGAAAMALPLNYGADFIFYGPMAISPWIYPALSTTDALNSYGLIAEGIRPGQKDIPLHKIF